MLELGQTRGLRNFGRKEDWEPPERRPPCPATPAWGGGRGCRPQPPSLPSWAGWCPRFSSCGLQGSPANSSFASPFCGGGSEPGEATDGELRQMQPSTAWRGPKWPHGGLSMAAFSGSLYLPGAQLSPTLLPEMLRGICGLEAPRLGTSGFSSPQLTGDLGGIPSSLRERGMPSCLGWGNVAGSLGNVVSRLQGPAREELSITRT